jgi:hypothetical protein
VTAGTIFQGTRKPLRLWFIAVWEIVGHKYGANAMDIQRMLGLRSYETAWAWLHKLRRAMVRPDHERLHGIVEVDETYVGGEEGLNKPFRRLIPPPTLSRWGPDGGRAARPHPLHLGVGGRKRIPSC